MREIYAGGPGKKHSAEMDAAAGACRRVIEFARLRLGERNQLLNVVDGNRLVHHDNERTGGDQSDRREILAWVIADIWVKCRVDGERAGTTEPERISVGCGLGDSAGADRAAGAAAVLDDERVAESF